MTEYTYITAVERPEKYQYTIDYTRGELWDYLKSIENRKCNVRKYLVDSDNSVLRDK